VVKNTENLLKAAISGTFWMFSASLTQQFIRFLISLVLARILIPTDFGTAALVSSIVTLVQVFSELGVSVAIVQRKSIGTVTVDSALMISFATAICLSAALWFPSGVIARFFSISELESLLHIGAVSVIFRTLFSFYRSLLLRDLRYKTISAIEAGGIVIYGFCAIIMAVHGFGASCIVIGLLIQSVCSLVIAALLTRYLPQGFGSLQEMKRLFKFGIWVLTGQFVGRACGQFDKLLIGKLIDAKTLGGYHLAKNLATILPNSIVKMPKQVMLPIFSRWQDDRDRIEKNYWRMIRVTSSAGLPVCALIAILAEPLILVLYGPKWQGSISLLRILAIFAALHCFGSGVMTVIYAFGKPQLATVINLLRLILLPVALLVGSSWGVHGIAWGIVGFEVIARIFNHGLLAWRFKFRFFKFFQIIAWPIIASTGMTLVGFGTMRIIFTPQSFITMVTSAAAAGLISIIFFIAVARWTMPEETLLIISEVRGKVFRLMLKNYKLNGTRANP
jgi:O-antigen/teichoic acid export membrane protein